MEFHENRTHYCIIKVIQSFCMDNHWQKLNVGFIPNRVPITKIDYTGRFSNIAQYNRFSAFNFCVELFIFCPQGRKVRTVCNIL